MKRRLVIFSIALMMLFVGCKDSNSSRIATSETSRIETLSAANIPFLTVTEELPIENTQKTSSTIKEPECTNVKTKETMDNLSFGSVLLESQENIPGGLVSTAVYRLNLDNGVSKLLNARNTSLSELAVSPDREKYVVSKLIFNTDGKLTEKEILLYSSEGIFLKTLPWNDQNTWPSIFGWLNDQWVILTTHESNFSGQSLQSAAAWVLINIETEENKVLRPNYPDIYSLPPLPDWEGAGITMYDPSLTRVFYLHSDQNIHHIGYSLYDLQHQEQVASFDMCCSLRAIPRWSPNGEELAVATVFLDQNRPPYELYGINREGVVKRLTFLSNSYPFTYIDKFSWSPDGRKIGFWFSHGANYGTIGEEHLAILDLATGIVNQYCIPGDFEASPDNPSQVPPPLWSPDGKQVIIQNRFSKDHSRVILFDPAQNIVVEIAKDMKPVGWLSK